ncbi:MAG: hypothetical protein EHM24_26300 [Acidobacteria bacterium]|nr:MAG: hypothetical protein EHM24_26300 [Acidobacteriota bacterium]
MKGLYRLAASAAVAVTLASPAVAGQVRLEIRNGVVTLDAKDASVREILAEWARVGRTRIVNGERAPGSLLTLQLTDVPENKALDIVLRASAGYIAAPRRAIGEAGSQYDRIVVMAIPRPASGGGAPGIAGPPGPPDRGMNQGDRGMPDRGNVYPPQPGVMVDDQDQPVVQPQPTMAMPGSSGQPGMPTAPPQAAPYYQPGGAVPPGGTPGTVVPAPPANRPGMPTTPVKPPGSPGGEGGQGGQGGQSGPGGE